jgi:hypothetical protein
VLLSRKHRFKLLTRKAHYSSGGCRTSMCWSARAMAEAQSAAVLQAAALVEEAAELSSNFAVQLCAEERSSRVAKLNAAALQLLTSVDCGAQATSARAYRQLADVNACALQKAARHLPPSAVAR